MAIRFLQIFVLIFSYTFLYAQKGKIKGTVYEVGTKNILAFVSIVVKENNLGTVTDIDGKFLISKATENFTLKISYVGFKTKEILINQNDSNLNIELEPEDKRLEAVVIKNEENPAFRIIRQLLKNKNNNNPELLSSFKYNSYTISTLGLGSFFSKNPNAIKPKKVLSNKEKINDSISLALFRKFKDNYLMVTESYIERIFRYPNRSKETVLASKVSGFIQAPFAITTSSFQPFGFYKDYLQIGVDVYVSPLIKGNLNLYNFKLTDKFINNNDTTFIIQFEPKKNKNFKGLKGLLYINSAGYAIENLIVSPSEQKGIPFNFKLQQQYEKIKGKWFPKQLNTTITQTPINSDSSIINWDSRSYITNISIGDFFPLSSFSDVKQVFDKAASLKTESDFSRFRIDSLTTKEKGTYTIYESLPLKTLNKFSLLNKLVNTIALNAIACGKVDIPLKYFLNGINLYEGFRVGGGFQTNQLLNKNFSFGAFVGYGIKDKAWKYGGNVLLTIKERTNTLLSFSYQRNLKEPVNIDYFTNKVSALINQTGRNFIASRMDSIEQFKFDFTTKITPAIQTNVWLQNENLNPAKYDYLFLNEKKAQLQKQFINTEIGFGFRYTKGEEFIKIGRAKIQNKPATTQLLFQLASGVNDLWKGEFDYTKIAIQLNQIFNSKRFGQTSYQLDAGKIFGDLPYPYLLNNKASLGEKNNSIYIPNTFQTVALYEFAYSQAVNLFIQNDFGSLLFKPKSKNFRPTIAVIQGIAFGSINNASNHKLISFKSSAKGLYESGFMIKNLYKQKLNTFYLGLGAGIFYRYGYYHLEKEADNWAFKIGINFSVN